jgi:hypothetical protein
MRTVSYPQTSATSYHTKWRHVLEDSASHGYRRKNRSTDSKLNSKLCSMLSFREVTVHSHLISYIARYHERNVIYSLRRRRKQARYDYNVPHVKESRGLANTSSYVFVHACCLNSREGERKKLREHTKTYHTQIWSVSNTASSARYWPLTANMRLRLRGDSVAIIWPLIATLLPAVTCIVYTYCTSCVQSVRVVK